jgi:putative hydrolases of HD superfamily
MDIKNFYQNVRNLKLIKRTGWVERGVKDPESVSDHSFMVALLCLAFPKDGIYKDKAVMMALVHDLAESKTGDIISKENWPEGGTMSSSEKSKLEEDAIQKILSNLQDEDSDEIFRLWKEYDEGKTPEAKFVRDIDILERTMQALEYHVKGDYEKTLVPFFENKAKIEDPEIRSFLEEYMKGMV